MAGEISDVLKHWPYDADNTIRIIKAKDGRELLQVRLPLGVEQYELEGRPDGFKPHGQLSVLDEFSRRLNAHKAGHKGEERFSLNHEDILQLQNEGVLFYLRYLLLFQIGDYLRTERDTTHNLQICELVESYCQDPEDRKTILQYKPYILRINAIARAMMSVQRDIKAIAKQILESAIEEIDTLPEIDSAAFKFEKIRSINYLKSALDQLFTDDSELGTLHHLEAELKKAVEYEEYETAAEIRDKIKALKQSLGKG